MAFERNPLLGAFWDEPWSEIHPLNRLVGWYARRVSDPTGEAHVSALLRAGIQRISHDYERITQSEICALSGRPPTVLKRYFGSVENLEAVSWAIQIELSLEGDFVEISGERAESIFRLSGPEIFPDEVSGPFGHGEFRMARRTNRHMRAVGFSILRTSETGRELLNTIMRRLSNRVSTRAYSVDDSPHSVRHENLLVRSALIPILSTAEVLGDLEITATDTPRVLIERIWWEIMRATAISELPRRHSGAPMDAPTSSLRKAVDLSFPGYSPKALSTMTTLSERVIELLATGTSGSNDLWFEKELPFSKLTSRSYLGPGRQLIGTAGLLQCLAEAIEIRDFLRSSGSKNRDQAIAAVGSRQVAPSVHAVLANPADERSQHIGRAISQTFREIAESLSPGVSDEYSYAMAEFLCGMSIPLSPIAGCPWLPPARVEEVLRAGWKQVLRSTVAV